MSYSELTWRYFENTAAAGTAGGPDWFRGQAGSRAAGTWVQFDVEVRADCGRAMEDDENCPGAGAGDRSIRSVRFLAFGCPHVIAVSQWVAEQASGRAVRGARLPEGIEALRARFEVPVEKLGRLFVVEDAWTAALRAVLQRNA